MVELSFWNLPLTPIYFLIILFIGYRIKSKNIEKNSIYKYYLSGLFVKLLGAFLFCMVYSFYYNGGDTGGYFHNSICLINLFGKNTSVAFSILMNNLSMTNHSYFDLKTGMPHWYMFRDESTYSVSRFTVPFAIMGAKTFVPTSLLVSAFSYIGVWKLFKLFTEIYPKYTKQFAYTILFMPSFVFWGSGIMKDTYIICATSWFTYSFYKTFISRDKVIINFVLVVLNFWIIMIIKPYVISALLLAVVFWLNSAYLNKIKNAFIKAIAFPFIIILITGGSAYVFANISTLLGDYGSFDKAVERAQITQQDLLREDQYGSNSYNLGNIDASVSGLLKKAPLAIFTAIYRPSLIEMSSISVIFSVIENTFLLLFTIYILFKIKLVKLASVIRMNPLIQYSFIFSLVLAFGVGIATANFGAMVRYKIPLIPFYFSSLYLIYTISQESREEA